LKKKEMLFHLEVELQENESKVTRVKEDMEMNEQLHRDMNLP
jgi:hypothetical protein